MESERVPTCADPLHVCDWWQFDRLCGKKDHELVGNRRGLALGDHLFIARNSYLADHGLIDKHSVWSIQIFFKLYAETGGKGGVVEIKGRKSEGGSRKSKVGSYKSDVGSRKSEVRDQQLKVIRLY